MILVLIQLSYGQSIILGCHVIDNINFLINSKLINKSVPGTVDLRALSKISGSAAQQNEAMEDNMTLVIESARAIGCQVSDSMLDKIIQRDPEVINNLLVDLIRVSLLVMGS